MIVGKGMGLAVVPKTGIVAKKRGTRGAGGSSITGLLK